MSALEAIASGTPIRQAARQFGIPRATIQDRLHGRTPLECDTGRPTKLSKEDEDKLVDFASNRSSMGLGFNKKTFLR